MHDDNAYYSCNHDQHRRLWLRTAPPTTRKIVVAAFEQFTDLVNEGKQSSSTTTTPVMPPLPRPRRYFLEEDLICPTVYDVSWCLTHANEYSKINAMYGPCNYKAVNWETSEEAYTTVQYEQFAKAFDLASQG